MKRFFTLFLAMVLALLALSGCKKKQKRVLHLYNWGDYISEDMLARFEKEFDCKVKVDVFDSNEAMYAKLKAGAGGYDVVVPSSYMAKVMYNQGMLLELNKDQLPNVVEHLDTSYLPLMQDKSMKYSVPYFVSFTGIGYNTKQLKDFKPSWKMFEEASINHRCSLLNDQREVLGAALSTLGYSVNTTHQEQLDEAVKLIQSWKKNIAKFGVDDCKMALASGEFFMIQTYSGDMLQVMIEKPEIAFVIPEEGSTVTFDNFCITKNSENVDLAYAFINFMYDPEVSASNMDEIMYVSPNTEALVLVCEELKNNPAFNLPEDARSRCQALEDLGDDNTKYVKAWDKIREEK